MTPKEKAQELFNKHYMPLLESESDLSEEILVSILARKAALITVDEILLSNPTWFIDQMKSTHKYWEKVKSEIELL